MSLFKRCAAAGRIVVLSLLCSSVCHAAEEQLAIVEDVKLYVTAPLRWDRTDWLYAGGSVLAIAASHHYDDSVRRHFAVTPVNTSDSHSKSDFLPAAVVVAGTWAMSWLWHDQTGYQEGRDMIEAGTFSIATTLVLKQVVRRERVSDTADSNAWFKHGDSFPSNHVSAAMAVGAVLAESGGEDYRWVRRGLGYGLGAATGYLRVKHQQHWLSDTVASAALGVATAKFVLNRHGGGSDSALLLTPSEGGLMLSYAAAFH